MNKFLLPFLLTTVSFTYAQVGINTNDPKATLEVKGKPADFAVADGIIVPRLTGDQLRAKNALYTNTAPDDRTGTMVFVTTADAAPAGKTINVTTPGYYFFDGSVWQRVTTGVGSNIYNSNGSISANRVVEMPSSRTLAFTPSGTQIENQFSIDGTTFSIDALNNRVGIGSATPNGRLDIRTNPISTTDPGVGFFGLGTTVVSASSAGAGALRYSTSSGGVIEYSNGTLWNTLTSTVQKATVIAKKTSIQTFANVTETNVTDWSEIDDLTNNFDPLTGIFTAPRTGNYVVSFSYCFTASNNSAGSQAEAILVTSSGTANDKKAVTPFNNAGSSAAGASITFTIRLTSGETLRPLIWHNLGTTRSLRVGTGADDGFVNFSVAEL